MCIAMIVHVSDVHGLKVIAMIWLQMLIRWSLAALPLRPGDGFVLEDLAAAFDREHLRDGPRSAVAEGVIGR